MSPRDEDHDTAPTVGIYDATVSRRGAASGAPSIFAVGETIANRYLIRKFIAFGGMGEVYEAEDTALRDKVALKTIRADVAHDERMKERFKREIALARKITHQNICRIFDLGFHPMPDGREQMFLSMELLPGETLAQRVRLLRPMTAAEALPVARQMVAALDAAHREGIVHRDFKSGNVMLVPDAGREGGVRVVVTDFGLARAEADPFATQGASGEGEGGLLGSPAYMAPEQVEGGPITPATDIYALGVVLFEMVTGKVPFLGETAMAVAVKRIKEKAPSPRTHVPDLDERWERALLRCLERNAADRYAQVTDVLRGLAGEETAPPARVVAERTRRRRGTWLVAAGLAAAVAVVGVFLSTRRGPTQAHPAATPARPAGAARASVAVLGFKNLSGKPDVAWLSTALSEMLTTELAAGGELRTLPGESIARMKHDLQLSDAESFAQDTLGKIHQNLGADYVVVGSYVPLGDKFRLDVRLQDAQSGETVLQVADTGTEAELAALVGRTGAQLRAKLRVGQVPESEVALVNAALPHNPEAARLYSEGLAKLRLYEAAAARDLLEKAIAVEPEFALAHSSLSNALDYLGYESRAHEEAKKAFDQSGALPKEERLRVEGQYWSMVGDQERATDTWKQLYAIAPDNLAYAANYATALVGQGNEAEGLEIVDKLRRSPRAKDDPRLYMVLMGAAYLKNDYGEVLRNMKDLERAGEQRGALSLVAEAKHMTGYAQWFMGNLNESVATMDEATRIATTLGDRDGVSDGLNTKAFVLTERGDYAEAQKLAEQSFAVATEVGSRRRIWYIDHVLARCAFYRGDLVEGHRLFEASRKAGEEVGSKYGAALGYLGEAVTLMYQGELDKAKPMYEKIFLAARIFSPKHNAAFMLHYLGDLNYAMGDLAEARKNYEQGLAERQEIGEALQAQRDKVSLAVLDIDEGRLVEAEKRLRETLPLFQKWELKNDESLAEDVLARALAAQGKRAEAEALLATAAEAAAPTESEIVKLDLALAKGLVLGTSPAAGARAEAKQALEPAIAEAKSKGWTGYSLQLRLALADVLAREGEKARARELSAQVAKDAHAKGYQAIARRASTGR